MRLKVTFLGTGTSQGIPVIANDHEVCFSEDQRDKRLRVSILIEWNDYCYVVDCGPDFRYQMLRANVKSINGILFTHKHADHTAGLDDIRPFSFQMGAVPLYGTQELFDNLKKRFDYIFDEKEKYPGAPSVIQNTIENKPFKLHNKKVIPVEYKHGDLTVFGYRIDNFAYITDIKSISEAEKQKLKGLHTLVISVIRYKEHHSHMSYSEVLNLIEELQPKRVYLTHLSCALGFHAELDKNLPNNVSPAYDGLEIMI